jgi:hypothetical protein
MAERYLGNEIDSMRHLLLSCAAVLIVYQVLLWTLWYFASEYADYLLEDNAAAAVLLEQVGQLESQTTAFIVLNAVYMCFAVSCNKN